MTLFLSDVYLASSFRANTARPRPGKCQEPLYQSKLAVVVADTAIFVLVEQIGEQGKDAAGV